MNKKIDPKLFEKLGSAAHPLGLGHQFRLGWGDQFHLGLGDQFHLELGDQVSFGIG